MLTGNSFRAWKLRSSWAVASLLIPLLTHCGGQTELVSIEQSTGGTTGASTGGAAGVSGSSSTGGTTAITSSGQSCLMPASDLDYSCTVDSDCVAVPGGDPCSPNCDATCRTNAVNYQVAAKYLSDFTSVNEGSWEGLQCNCPCLSLCCRQGICGTGCGFCNSQK